MKDLSSLLKTKFKNNTATAKRAQIRNEILIRGVVKMWLTSNESSQSA